MIAWSWDLLTPREQQALAWLSVFHDGVGIGSAEAVLGADAMDQVEALVDQSLLAVDEADGVAHYRMLETVREFGDPSSRRGRRDRGGRSRRRPPGPWSWPTGSVAHLFGEGQVAAVDELSHEENNLADVLRRAMAEDDAGAAVRLMATLGTFWAITGNNPRVFAMIDAAERMLERWEPPPELVPATQDSDVDPGQPHGLLPGPEPRRDDRRDGAPRVPEQPWSRAIYAMFVEAESEGDRIASVLRVADDAGSRRRR